MSQVEAGATSVTLASSSEEAGSNALDPDIARLTSGGGLCRTISRSYRSFDDEEEETDGNERDDEREHSASQDQEYEYEGTDIDVRDYAHRIQPQHSESAVMDDDEEQSDEPFEADDVEASFIQCEKPQCTKTTLVSCLSSRSTSPGPMSPLLSDDDTTLHSETSSGSSSRRQSESATQRVRFKRGCVITQVNLTWAAQSYDRAPIDVAQSLDMKRCHSIDTNGEDADADGDRWVSYVDTLAASPPSPPLPSSPCTAAHAAFAYANTVDHPEPHHHHQHQQEHVQQHQQMQQQQQAQHFDSSPEQSPVPGLVHDDSSGSGSDSDEFQRWLNNCHAQSASYYHHNSLGAAARELESICSNEGASKSESGERISRLDAHLMREDESSHGVFADRSEPEEGNMTPKARRGSEDVDSTFSPLPPPSLSLSPPPVRSPSPMSTSSSASTASDSAAVTTPVQQTPAKKSRCALYLKRFSQPENLFDSDALGGF